MPQPSLILHHYASSPFAEKVRLALGLKNLAWHSVEIANMPPRPLLDPLTGGYRRVPVLQIGADVYCDTHCILPALDRLHPEPSLFRQADALAKALVFDFEHTIWLAAIGVRTHFAEDPPAAFLRDREQDYLYVDMSKAAMAPHFERNRQLVAAHVAWLAAALIDGRPYLSGAAPGALDLGFFHALWLIRNGNPVERVDAALGFAPLVPWYDRIAALGHGRPEPLDAQAALDAARSADPQPVEGVLDPVLADFALGQRVSVTPTDFARRPVEGALVATDLEQIVIAREDAEVGRLHLHFPRAGFELQPADGSHEDGPR